MIAVRRPDLGYFKRFELTFCSFSLLPLNLSWRLFPLIFPIISRHLTSLCCAGVAHADCLDVCRASTSGRGSRQATPASLVRRRQRQLSSRRAHALRARRRGEIGEAAPVASGRQRTRRRTSAAELAGSEAGAASGSGQFGKGDNVEEARTTRYLTREEEIELCAAVKVPTYP